MQKWQTNFSSGCSLTFGDVIIYIEQSLQCLKMFDQQPSLRSVKSVMIAFLLLLTMVAKWRCKNVCLASHSPKLMECKSIHRFSALNIKQWINKSDLTLISDTKANNYWQFWAEVKGDLSKILNLSKLTFWHYSLQNYSLTQFQKTFISLDSVLTSIFHWKLPVLAWHTMSALRSCFTHLEFLIMWLESSCVRRKLDKRAIQANRTRLQIPSVGRLGFI